MTPVRAVPNAGTVVATAATAFAVGAAATVTFVMVVDAVVRRIGRAIDEATR